MTTAARPISSEGSHWYQRDGTPCHTVMGKTTGRERPTTITDARKLGLLPSVTNVLRCLHKEALVQWKVEQAVLACLTSPRNDGEPLDAFVERILHTEKVQDQEAAAARDMGSRVHQALEDELSGRHAEQEMLPWIEPVWEWLNNQGYKTVLCERVVVGEGYAGRTDLMALKEPTDPLDIWDFKTTKNPPKKSAWWEHQMQLAAYGMCQFEHEIHTPEEYNGSFRCGNIYISTVKPGEFVVCQHTEIDRAWEGFQSLLKYWQVANDYVPM